MTAALLALVVFGAFTIEALAGFGSTVLAVAVGVHLLPLPTLLAALVPVNLALSLLLVLRHWRHLDLRLLLRDVLPWMALGLPLGLWLLGRLPEALLLGVFAVFVLATSLAELRTVAPRPLPSPLGAALLCAGGVIHGAYASGGPMVVYVLTRTTPDKARFRTTLSALWLVLNAALVLGYAFSGAFDRHTATLSAALVPSLALGLFTGERLHDKVSPPAFRRLVLVLLALAGALLLIRTGGLL